MFHRILIANRGEIAVRVIRTCRELEVETVAVYSTADADALHVKLATEAVCIGPAKAADSYLNMSALLTAALETGCDAIHPGYGFLSENPEFADLCRQCGLKFIGPSGDVIRQMGNKAAARALMRRHGVPVVPGSDGPVPDAQTAAAIAAELPATINQIFLAPAANMTIIPIKNIIIIPEKWFSSIIRTQTKRTNPAGIKRP